MFDIFAVSSVFDSSVSVELLVMLAMVAMLAGFIDAIAGGGGLLTIPALLLANVPPVMALGTNKLQGCAGAFSASLTMLKKDVVKPSSIKIAIVTAFVGSMIGSILVQVSPPELLTRLIPILIAIIGVYTLFAPSLGEVKGDPKISNKAWQMVCVPIIGLYDGYVGPGTGMFLALGNVAMRGKDIIEATGIAKILNFSTNLASLVVFLAAGNILWKIGLVMMVGQVIGAFFGSKMVVSGGVRLIRPVIVIVCLLMLAKYTFT